MAASSLGQTSRAVRSAGAVRQGKPHCWIESYSKSSNDKETETPIITHTYDDECQCPKPEQFLAVDQYWERTIAD